VGLATYFASGIKNKKSKGKIKEVSEKLHLEELPGEIGIGHVRWAPMACLQRKCSSAYRLHWKK
jgi:glucosamine 6-phosphate synthetase-like amidotransferase/phosphosugar isomerase protein